MSRITAILAVILSLAFTPLAAQDFQKGLAAAQSSDFATALRELKPLADQGDADAQSKLGYMYSKGQGVSQDDAEAVRLWRPAAEQGDADAQYGLGVMYDNGAGVPQDYGMAHMWFNIASANGHSMAGVRRDKLGYKLTLADTSKAQAMARECMSSGYSKCGY